MRWSVSSCVVVCSLLLALQACSTAPVYYPPRPDQLPPVVEQGSPAPAVRHPRPVTTTPVPGSQPPQAAAATRPAAVVALAEQAEQQANDGDLESAAASLQRAIRIDPRNAVLWHHLATVRLAQGDHAQAEQLAVKSNSLAAGNNIQQARNWRLIAKARAGQGDSGGAAAAERRASALAR